MSPAFPSQSDDALLGNVVGVFPSGDREQPRYDKGGDLLIRWRQVAQITLEPSAQVDPIEPGRVWAHDFVRVLVVFVHSLVPP